MDFVIPWVNGQDPNWRKELNLCRDKGGNSKDARFRDWDNLQFLFRGFEQFTPWVDKIHFITWGHLPEWLNTAHPKLHIVRHKDFIPQKYLPTFNARTIELNLHRIEGLHGQYVFFNDDTFLLKKIRETVFFKNGKPCDKAAFDAFTADTHYQLTLFTDLSVIMKHFSKYRAVAHCPFNWFNLKYGGTNFKNLLLFLAKRGHTGFDNPHLPQPHLKDTLEILWKKEYANLDRSCRQTFRIYDTVNQYLQRYWNLASNNFHPSPAKGRFFRLDNKKILSQATTYIKNQKKPTICINDSDVLSETEFQFMKKEIKAAFEEILPEKSSFEI